jgi:epoxyqueuosine reductase
VQTLTVNLRQKALEQGFELVGFTAARPPVGLDRFLDWLEQGYAGQMQYLEKGAAARFSPEAVLPGVRSIVMLGMSYHQPAVRQQSTPELHGRVATYALGCDYHELLWSKLNLLTAWLTEQAPGSQSRGVVDTAPLLERDFARLGGLGWFGKNTMLINKKMGSFFLLAALLTTVELEIDQPHVSSHCGTCTACLDACPTQAFPEPGVLDASKCISYFTIELKGSIPVEHRPGIGDWAFGCDICQDVCPWNRKAPSGQTPELLSASWQSGSTKTLDLITLLQMPIEEFRQHFRGTALWRTKRQGLLRNACIVLGNQRDQRAIPALEQLKGEGDEVIREAAEWALIKLSETLTGTDHDYGNNQPTGC